MLTVAALYRFAPFDDPAALIASTPPSGFSIPFPGGLSSPVRVAIGGVVLEGGTLLAANTVLLNVR